MPSVCEFMKRLDLEYLIRAAGKIGQDSEIVVIGSHAILGQFPDAPESLLTSAEAGVFPLNRPEKSNLIDGAIGEGSRFHQEYGYYALRCARMRSVLQRGYENQSLTCCEG
jgi:hypothetical protein